MNSPLSKVKEIERIIAADDLSDAKKVQSIKSLLESQAERKQIEEQMRAMEHEANRIIKDNDYYDILNSKSLRLQNRVLPIVKALEFDACESADEIIQAIEILRIIRINICYANAIEGPEIIRPFLTPPDFSQGRCP